MREYVRRTIAELDQEIADLTKARDALLRLDAGTPAPTAPRARPAKRSSAKPAAARKKPAPAKPEAAKPVEPPEVSDTGVRILKFLDKAGPSDATAVVAGVKGHPPGTMNALKRLVRLGLAEDNDGHFRCTDKGFDAALA